MELRNLPNLVFLPGFMGCAKDWDEIISQLGSKYSCFGLSYKDLLLTSSYQEGLILLRDKLKEIAPFILIGYSMGGRIAWHFTHSYPDLVESLIIESSNPYLRNAKDRELRRVNDKNLLKTISTEEEFGDFLNRWYRNPIFGKIQLGPRYSHLINSKSHLNIPLYQKQIELYGVGQFEPTDLSNFHRPIHYIFGELDYKYEDIGKRLEISYPNLQAHKILTSGHNCHFEQCSQFISLLKEIIHGL